MKLLLLFLLSTSLFAQNQKADLKVGETFYYDVTFGSILRGKTVIKYFGKTMYDSTDHIFITYDTRFIGNIYSLHADIYATEDFSPVRIETRIRRPGKLSKGLELFFRDKNMAIFSQVTEGEYEIDTILREHPIQDVTTLPFYLMGVDLEIGSTLDLSLPQGELKLTAVKIEEVVIGEENFSTIRIESEPPGIKIWLNRKNKIPIKVYIAQSKIKMRLNRIEIDESIAVKNMNEKEKVENNEKD